MAWQQKGDERASAEEFMKISEISVGALVNPMRHRLTNINAEHIRIGYGCHLIIASYVRRIYSIHSTECCCHRVWRSSGEPAEVLVTDSATKPTYSANKISHLPIPHVVVVAHLPVVVVGGC